MKKYEIWAEGYITNGMRAGACKFGEMEANSFQEACDKFFKGRNLTYDREQLTFWDCRLEDLFILKSIADVHRSCY